jgi:hypothetical protein
MQFKNANFATFSNYNLKKKKKIKTKIFQHFKKTILKKKKKERKKERKKEEEEEEENTLPNNIFFVILFKITLLS